MFSKLVISALGAASAVSALVPRGVCNADNCLRALRATSPNTRLAQAQQDCAAWLVVTVTPPVSTSTAFSTISLTATSVESDTVTNTIISTATSTVNETPTQTVYTSTATSTVEADPVTILVKRDAPTIPAYASPCSGAVRFSSACSCLGAAATPSTVTLPASTITVTVPTTVSTTTAATSVVATSDVVIVDTTIVQTVTAPATTAFAVTSTVLSETSTRTSTTAQAPTSTALRLSIQGGVRGSGFVGTYESTGLSYAIFVATADQAIDLVLNPDGSLYYGSKIAYGDQTGGALPFFFLTPGGGTVRKPLSCAVDLNDVLTCQNIGTDNNKFGITTQMNLTPVIYTGSEAKLLAGSRPLVTLKVIRI